VQGIYESIIGVLETNRRALDIEALKRAVSWLSDARQILALGMGGGSTICAQEIQYRLFRLGLPVVSQNDGLLVRMMSSAVTPKDVVIVLSLGGYTQEIIESAAIARQYGAKVIAITPAGTPLAEQADLVLPLLVRENDYIFKPSTSRYAMLAMVDVLATELAMANKTQAKGKLRRIKLALDSHRGGVDQAAAGRLTAAAAINLSACCGYVPRPARRDTDRCPDRRRRIPPRPSSPDSPASRRRPPAPAPPAAAPLSAPEYSPGRRWKTGKSSATAPRRPAR
jgi:D-arabinose 5-phosphate isomerase GutQ